MEITLLYLLFIVVIAFVCEYVDSTFGMGYGTTLTPLLLIMGFTPLEIIPAVLISELFTGILAGFFHHKENNIDFRNKTNQKIVGVLGCSGIFGVIIAVCIVLSLPEFWLKLYIGVLILSIGLFVLYMRNKTIKFSWPKICCLGLLASFNKGMSGGGYGPLVCPGQILSGVKSKSAVAITSVSESITCLVGIIMYLIFTQSISLAIAPYIAIGAMLSVPLSAKSIKIIPDNYFKILIGVITIIMGSITICKVLI